MPTPDENLVEQHLIRRQTAAQWLSAKGIIDTSIIHDTLAVIANEVKQSSKKKCIY
jgi:hypothetical protein